MHVLHHDPANGDSTSYVTLGDIVEMIEVFTGFEVNGLRAPGSGELRPRLDAPITVVGITDGGARFEGRIERLTFHLTVGPTGRTPPTAPTAPPATPARRRGRRDKNSSHPE